MYFQVIFKFSHFKFKIISTMTATPAALLFMELEDDMLQDNFSYISIWDLSSSYPQPSTYWNLFLLGLFSLSEKHQYFVVDLSYNLSWHNMNPEKSLKLYGLSMNLRYRDPLCAPQRTKAVTGKKLVNLQVRFVHCSEERWNNDFTSHIQLLLPISSPPSLVGRTKNLHLQQQSRWLEPNV